MGRSKSQRGRGDANVLGDRGEILENNVRGFCERSHPRVRGRPRGRGRPSAFGPERYINLEEEPQKKPALQPQIEVMNTRIPPLKILKTAIHIL